MGSEAGGQGTDPDKQVSGDNNDPQHFCFE